MIALVLAAGSLAACNSSASVDNATPATGTPGSPSTGGGSPTTSTGTPGVPLESPVPSENSPPGDIPDSIAYVPYRSMQGRFTISTPEGWARTNTSTSVQFTDKLNTVLVSWQPASTAPTVTSAKTTEVPAIAGSTRAFQLETVTSTSLPAGPAVLVTYQANSEPNSVTGKQYRQAVLRYELFHDGKEVVLTLLSPVGADNVDPWRIVTESLKWR